MCVCVCFYYFIRWRVNASTRYPAAWILMERFWRSPFRPHSNAFHKRHTREELVDSCRWLFISKCVLNTCKINTGHRIGKSECNCKYICLVIIWINYYKKVCLSLFNISPFVILLLPSGYGCLQYHNVSICCVLCGTFYVTSYVCFWCKLDPLKNNKTQNSGILIVPSVHHINFTPVLFHCLEWLNGYQSM